MSKDVTFI